jgi:flagellin
MSKLLRNSDKVSLSGASVRSKLGSQRVLPEIDSMLKEVSGARAAIGAIQNRVHSMVSNLQVSKEGVSAANSRIRDTDVAKASASKAISSIKTDASAGYMAHSNNISAGALKLIE